MVINADNNFDDIKDYIYNYYNIIDLNEFHKIKDILLKSDIYLPVLLRRLIGYKYFERDIIFPEKIYQSKEYYGEAAIDEFIEWINDNPDFNNLLNEKNYNCLIKDITLFNNLVQKYGDQ